MHSLKAVSVNTFQTIVLRDSCLTLRIDGGFFEEESERAAEIEQ